MLELIGTMILAIILSIVLGCYGGAIVFVGGFIFLAMLCQDYD